MGRKNRRSNRGMNRRSKRSKRSKRNKRTKRSNMRGGDGEITMVVKNVNNSESINLQWWDDNKNVWSNKINVEPSTAKRQSTYVGTAWRVTRDTAGTKELSWVLADDGRVQEVHVDFTPSNCSLTWTARPSVNFTSSSASATVSDSGATEPASPSSLDSGATEPPPISFREHTALTQYPDSASQQPGSQPPRHDASVTVSDKVIYYKKDWKETTFYHRLFPHTELVQRHAEFKKGDTSGDFIVTRDSQNSDPENSRIENYYHYITHVPSGKTYWDTQRFFS